MGDPCGTVFWEEWQVGLNRKKWQKNLKKSKNLKNSLQIAFCIGIANETQQKQKKKNCNNQKYFTIFDF